VGSELIQKYAGEVIILLL
jgi:26S proteasome regulatory subunit T2